MFVGRNIDGSIYGTWTSPQPNDEFHPRVEELPDTHLDIIAFRNRPVRVVESVEARLAALESRVESVELISKPMLETV